MANTWQAVQAAVTFAANKFMLDVFNSSSSTRYIRIYRAYYFNNQTEAITGVLNVMRVGISSASTGGTAVTPITMDSSNATLNANTTAGHNRTVTSSSVLRTLLTSPDEATVTTLDWDALATLVPFAEIWNAGYGDTNIQPVTLRASESRGFYIQSVTQTVGNADFEIMFTDAGS